MVKKKIEKKVVKKPVVKKKTLAAKKSSLDFYKTKIRIIGIGGGGCSIISEIAANLKKVDFVAANTDFYALKELPGNIKCFQFGQALTHGLGAGMQPEIGAEAARLEKDKIKKLLEGYDFCIFVSTLGGGTGSGAAPVFAKIGRELKSITYGIFTLPFSFEGEKKAQIARESLNQIKPYLNAFTIIPNEKIFQVVDKDTALKQALTIVNKNLAKSLEGLIETIYSPGLVNIDFADFKTVLEKRGRLTYLNTIETQGEDRTEEAIKKIAANPLYSYGIEGAKGILFNICGGKDLSLHELSQISESISQVASSEAKIIFGTSQNESLQNKIKITLLASGCSSPKLSIEEKKEQKPRRKKKVIKEPEKKEELKEEKPKAKQVKVKKQNTDLVVVKPKDLVVEPSKKEESSESLIKKTESPAVAPESAKIPAEKIELKRRNALQIKKAVEEAEKELLEQEVKWDTPAFLRRKGEINK